MTTEFVESLQRLFSSGKIALFKLDELKNKGVISQKGYEYITAKEKVGEQ